jgi:hypothetical protein
MLVYGDDARSESTRDKLARIEDLIAAVWRRPAGLARHGELVAAFIETGELAQGVVDAEFAVRQVDARSDAGEAVMSLLIGLARSVERSWSSGFGGLAVAPAQACKALSAAALPDELEISVPEGYAFYALYPECYIQAAGRLPGARVKIIGLRSIGTGLAAAVAAGAGQDDAFTMRPVGHPFRRDLALSRDFAAELLADPTADFAIADEGPGLSGSSFGCVADFLETAGVEPQRIHFFPSHRGAPGPQASERHLQRWRRARRHVVDFDDLVLGAPQGPHRLERWAADLVGEPVEPLREISGGEWRHLHFASSGDWPPANTQQERRKFLIRTADGPWLLRFAGLGRYGSEKVELASELASAGFGPPARGFRHGFTVEPWLADARTVGALPADRQRLVSHLGRYIGFRAHSFAANLPGASLERLATMARRNTGLALGEDAERRLRAWQSGPQRLARHVRPVRTDNRMHRWEWLASGERLVKTDALDHHAAHDLIGCQDPAWDIAGAAVEFALTESETERLCTIAEREAGWSISPELLGFLTPCYCAFQLGYYSLAADAHAGNAVEASRLRAAAARYTDHIRHRLMGEAVPAFAGG